MARGNLAEAMRAYDEIRVLLREELGTSPGPELLALYDQLLAPPAPAALTVSSAPGLLERDAELGEIAAALARLRAGEGGVLAFEGPAGIGKTRLLGVLRERALQAGADVLEARAGVLEREFGFGVVRQLFELVAASHPPPAAARSVFGEGASADGLFAVLSALFQYTATLASRTPLVLCIDDLQWSDTSSLRFVAYLTRRVSGLPVLVATTIRTGEPDSDELLLGEIGQDPATVAVAPRPLSEDGTAGMVSALLGEGDDAFAAACQDVTAGNPLLLRQLLTALAAEHVVPDASHAASVRAIGPRAVSRTVLLRLARLPAPAAEVARAVAVLGEQPGLPAIAQLSGADEATAAETIAALVRAEILRADEPLGFVHPLVRDAIYFELPAARRGLEHERAARLLDALNASPERIAAQLMLAPPRGDAWVVERLRAAASIAIERGAPDAALSHLQRAQAEPPALQLRSELTLELGAAAEFVRGTAAAETLAQAHAGLTDPGARGMAAVMLARTLLFMENPARAMTVVDEARAEQPEEDIELALRAIRIVGVFFGAADPVHLADVEAWRLGPRSEGPGAKTLTAITALAVAVLLGEWRESRALAVEALTGEEMPAFDRGTFTCLPAAVLAMAEPADAEPEWERIRALAGRRGSVLDAIGADLWGGLGAIWMGDLLRATELLERAMEGETLFGSAGNAHMAYSSAFLALAWLERGDVARAWEALRGRGDQSGPSDGERFWMISHAELLLADGRYGEVYPVTDALEATRPPETHPLYSPWRSLRARAAAGEGDLQTCVTPRGRRAGACTARRGPVGRGAGAAAVRCADRRSRRAAGGGDAAGRDVGAAGAGEGPRRARQ